jgi:hypothetical protein
VTAYTASVIRQRRRTRWGNTIVSNASNNTSATSTSPATPAAALTTARREHNRGRRHSGASALGRSSRLRFPRGTRPRRVIGHFRAYGARRMAITGAPPARPATARIRHPSPSVGCTRPSSVEEGPVERRAALRVRKDRAFCLDRHPADRLDVQAPVRRVAEAHLDVLVDGRAQLDREDLRQGVRAGRRELAREVHEPGLSVASNVLLTVTVIPLESRADRTGLTSFESRPGAASSSIHDWPPIARSVPRAGLAKRG